MPNHPIGPGPVRSNGPSVQNDGPHGAGVRKGIAMSRPQKAWSSRRTQIAVAVGALALIGSTLAVTTAGSATAEGEDFPDGGWPATQTALPKVDRGAGGPSRVIRLRAVTLREADMDIDGDGQFDAGDGFIFREKLVNPRTGKRVGQDLARCVGMGRVFDCEGTLNLPRGKLVVAGASWQGQGLVLAVTGGTWKFRRASGVMHVVPGPGGSDIFRIELN